jgi:hypothetical protein
MFRMSMDNGTWTFKGKNESIDKVSQPPHRQEPHAIRDHTFFPAMIHSASLSTASDLRIAFSSKRVIITSSSEELFSRKHYMVSFQTHDRDKTRRGQSQLRTDRSRILRLPCCLLRLRSGGSLRKVCRRVGT